MRVRVARTAAWFNAPAKRVTVAVLFLLICLLLGAGVYFQRNNTNALCSFRADLQKRVDSTTKFLEMHPNGIPGIPAATLRVSIQNQQATLKALSSLSC